MPALRVGDVSVLAWAPTGCGVQHRLASPGILAKCFYSTISSSSSHLIKECAAAWASSRLSARSMPCNIHRAGRHLVEPPAREQNSPRH
jgi:hypothetical protein